MNILGISCFYHDSAGALVVDGRLVTACSEERFSRKKHDSGFPVHAVNFCLKQAGIRIDQIDRVVFYDKPLTKFDRIVTGYMATPFRSYRPFLYALPSWLGKKLFTEHVIHKELGYEGNVMFLPHHLSHASGTFFSSPFDESAILTIDGVGEWANASYGIGRNNTIELLSEMHYPHSVGLLYSAFTYYLGFQVNSSEYKVMGLAPYGTPRFAKQIEEHVVTIHDDGSIHLNLDYFSFHHGLTMTSKNMERLFEKPRRVPDASIDSFHYYIASSIQYITEKIVLKMARHVREVTRMSRLCLSGGVALNCKANGLLLKAGIFDDIYVQPSSGDAGGAVGAALYAHYRLSGEHKRPQPFFGIGPVTNDQKIRSFLEHNRIPFIEADNRTNAESLAREIADGKIVGLFHGSAEFGPRALGFRSILADPRDSMMKEKINSAVKYREPFRPFAPAVLEECASDYFDCDRPSPYMLFNFTVHENKRNVIPAVTHIDHSSRIQTVNENDNPLFHLIISHFYKLTGVPVVLNTSFNLRGHPIVNSPKDAFATFASGGIDTILIGRYLLKKENISEEVLAQFRFKQKTD